MKQIFKPKRVQVTFTEEQWNVILKLKGIMGNSDADIVRNIVLTWLVEKSFIKDAIKNSSSNVHPLNRFSSAVPENLSIQ